jgi:hypothetical protein
METQPGDPRRGETRVDVQMADADIVFCGAEGIGRRRAATVVLFSGD